MQPTNTPTESDILYEFSLAFTTPSAKLLSDFLSRYPMHAETIVEFAAELSADVRQRPATVPVDQAKKADAVARGMSRYYNRRYDKQNPTAAVDVPNPLATRSTSEARAIAKNLGISLKLYKGLRERTIRSDTIPRLTRQHLARGFDVPVEAFEAHLAAQRVLHAGVRLKADARPELPEKQTWEEAVRASGLSEEEQRLLLSR